MLAKYHCDNCGKRYVDWGAEKLGFKCPDCEDEDLVPIGGQEKSAPEKPSLKSRPKTSPKPKPDVEVFEEEETPEDAEVLDEEEEEGDEAQDEDEEVTAPDAEQDSENVDPDEDEEDLDMDIEDDEEDDMELPEDLSFGEVSPPLGEAVSDDGKF